MRDKHLRADERCTRTLSHTQVTHAATCTAPRFSYHKLPEEETAARGYHNVVNIVSQFEIEHICPGAQAHIGEPSCPMITEQYTKNDATEKQGPLTYHPGRFSEQILVQSLLIVSKT